MAEQIQVTIVGTGCVGTSIGLALHQAKQPLLVVGHDKEPGRANTARTMKAIDKSDWNLIGACENADLLILAIPLNAIEPTMKAAGPYLKQGSVVTDTASLKAPVVEWAAALLPPNVHFVGGDPVVTSTGSGPGAASADLFRNSLYCITPTPSTHPDAVSLISGLAALLGGRPYYLDAAEHDGLAAGVAHLPHALALAMVRSSSRQAAWREMRKLAGGSFEQVGAAMGEDPDALADLLLANRDNLARWLDSYGAELQAIRDLLAAGEREPLAQAIDQAVVAYRQWGSDRRTMFNEASPGGEVERPDFLRQMLLGGRLGRK
jgi:prephenate dehydrogenase